MITPWPSDAPRVTREKKSTPAYGLSFSEAMYLRWNGNYTLWGSERVGFFRIMALFAQGKQDIYPYQAKYRGLDKNGTLRKGFNNISWDIPSVAPKHLGTIKKIISSSDFFLEVKSNSKEAVNKKALNKQRLWYQTQNNALRKQVSSIIGQEIPLKSFNWIPENQQELAIYEKYGGFKLPLETGLTKICEDIFKISDWEYIWDECVKDLTQTAHAVVMIVDNADGSTGIKHIPIEDYITSYTRNPNLDPPYCGHFDWMTIEELIPKLKESYPDLTTAQIENIAKANLSHNTGYNESSWKQKDPVTDRFSYYDFKVRVFYFFFKSVDTEYYEGRETKDGTYIYDKSEEGRIKKDYADGRKRKTDTYKNCTLYSGIRVVGQPYVLDYGPAKNVMKAPNGDVMMPYIHVTTGESSIVERWRGWLDDHQMAILKWRTALLLTKGNRTKYDMGVLANMDFGMGKMTQSEIVRYSEETGNLYVATRGDMLNRIDAKSAIEDMGSKDASPLALMQNIIAYIDAQIRSVVGITDAMAAISETNPEKLVGIGQQEIAASQNAMYVLAKTMVRLKSQCGMKGAAKTRVKLEFDDLTTSYYNDTIGEQFVDAVKAFKDLTLNQIGLVFRAKPSAERKAMIMEMVSRSLDAGRNNQVGITLADALMVENELEHGLTEMAIFYLSVAEARVAKQIEQNRSAATQETGQMQVQSAQAAAQAQARLEQVLSELRKSETGQKIAEQFQADSALEEIKHANIMQQEALKGALDNKREQNSNQKQVA
jgi:hypothetical protein